MRYCSGGRFPAPCARSPTNSPIGPRLFACAVSFSSARVRWSSGRPSYREAIELAQTLGAKAWGLRAAMSLARLLRDTGRNVDARTMLSAIYRQFTEGFDTADLKDAKVLLGQLNA
jgi:hypothetical protein